MSLFARRPIVVVGVDIIPVVDVATPNRTHSSPAHSKKQSLLFQSSSNDYLLSQLYFIVMLHIAGSYHNGRTCSPILSLLRAFGLISGNLKLLENKHLNKFIVNLHFLWRIFRRYDGDYTARRPIVVEAGEDIIPVDAKTNRTHTHSF